MYPLLEYSYNESNETNLKVSKNKSGVGMNDLQIDMIAYLGNKLWQILPQGIKQSSSLPIFKKQIRCWNGGKCNCRLCKVYIPKVGFLTLLVLEYLLTVLL